MDNDTLLAQEYGLLQKAYEDIGARALTVKAWSVTFSATGLGLAYTSSERIVLIFAAVGAAVFWFVEALLKSHQKAFVPRIESIERHFRREGSLEAAFQINAEWSRSFRGKGRFLRGFGHALYPHVALPHALIIIIGLGLFWICPPGVADDDKPSIEINVR